MAEKAIQQGRLQRARRCRVADPVPNLESAFFAPSRPAAAMPEARHGRIDRPGTRRADAVEPDAFVLEQAVENTPGKAPCAPPPCRARLIDLISTLGVGAYRGSPPARSPRCRPSCPLLVEPPVPKSRACRSRRNVRSGIDRRKCRLGIMRMRAGYRACRGTEILTAGWRRSAPPDVIFLNNSAARSAI